MTQERLGIPTVVTVHCMWSYATPIFAGLDKLSGWSSWPVVLSAVSDVAAQPIRRIAGPGTALLLCPPGITLWCITSANGVRWTGKVLVP